MSDTGNQQSLIAVVFSVLPAATRETSRIWLVRKES